MASRAAHSARLLFNEGKQQEAVAQAHALLAISPHDATANIMLGDYEQSHGNPSAAVKWYQNLGSQFGQLRRAGQGVCKPRVCIPPDGSLSKPRYSLYPSRSSWSRLA